MSKGDPRITSKGDLKGCDAVKGSETSKVVYEGWMVRCGRRKIGRSYIHMRYFVLGTRVLAYYKRKPQDDMVPAKTLVIDGNCRVEDRGLKTYHGHMGAFNIQEALAWKEKIELVIDQQELLSSHGTKSFESFKSGIHLQKKIFDPKGQGSPEDEDERNQTLVRKTTIGNGPPDSVFDWTQLEAGFSNLNDSDHTSSQKYWHLVRCQNGLRIFEELPQVDNLPRSCSRAMKAVGVVEATCEEIFESVMCMDENRFEWDCSFLYGTLVEEVDGHTAILYHQLRLECRVIPVKDTSKLWSEAWICGGFTISPLKPRNGRSRSQVQHLMQIDLKGWGVGIVPSFQQHSLIRMLSSVAGLREWFSQTDDIPRISRISSINDIASGPVSSKKDQNFHEPALQPSPSMAHRRDLSKSSIMLDEDSEDDEDFQISEFEHEASSIKPETDNKQTGLEVEPSGQIDLSCFSGNLCRDDHDNARNCWKISEGKNFKVRSRNFAFDKKSKVPAGKHLMELVAVDWFKDTKKMDHVARRPGCAAQVASERGQYSLVINLQIPGSTNYSLVFYFVIERLVAGSLLQQLFDADDEFRNSRFKLIPAVPKIDVDIGSSTVANGVLGLVLGVVTTLVVDMAFLIQANTVEELPEQLLGAVRISHIELSSAVVPVFDTNTSSDGDN
ncbi:hypothetical protein AXF42_Ash007083 [Apostasia shenzhenica]|uniref:START domain-containing protein n=1 Tax=Apostasia shenzhenica TaxID=1088818 RepID=A0A2I0BF51_9ASPA|nr:hypothetical protein AXF42_Ash007083 [Apostasia shenzhenica]